MYLFNLGDFFKVFFSVTIKDRNFKFGRLIELINCNKIVSLHFFHKLRQKKSYSDFYNFLVLSQNFKLLQCNKLSAEKAHIGRAFRDRLGLQYDACITPATRIEGICSGNVIRTMLLYVFFLL